MPGRPVSGFFFHLRSLFASFSERFTSRRFSMRLSVLMPFRWSISLGKRRCTRKNTRRCFRNLNRSPWKNTQAYYSRCLPLSYSGNRLLCKSNNSKQNEKRHKSSRNLCAHITGIPDWWGIYATVGIRFWLLEKTHRGADPVWVFRKAPLPKQQGLMGFTTHGAVFMSFRVYERFSQLLFNLFLS